MSPKYLQTLRQLRLLDREVPVTASRTKSKRSRYRVAHEFLRFWFRYVEPNRSKSGFVEGLEDHLDDRWSLWTLAQMDDLLTPS